MLRLAILPVIGLLVPLLLFELVLRAFGPILPGQYQLGMLMIRHDRYGQFHAPNASVWYRTDEYIAHVRTNRLGLRGPELIDPPAPATGRILIVGDSFVEARQVDEARTATSIVDSMLDGRPGGGGPSSSGWDGCEVINGGVAGWGTGEEYVYLREEGLRLGPDLVVLVVFLGNDVANNARRADPSSGGHVGPAFRVNGDGGLIEQPPRRAHTEPMLNLLLRGSSFAFTFLESGVLAKLSDDDDGSVSGIGKRDLFSPRESSEVRRAWRLTAALIGAIANVTREAGSRLLLVSAPASYQVYPEQASWLRSAARSGGGDGTAEAALTAPNRRMAEIAAELGLEHLDLLPALRSEAAAAPQRRLYFERDPHWTAVGQQVAGHELGRFLLARPERIPAACRGGGAIAAGAGAHAGEPSR